MKEVPAPPDPTRIRQYLLRKLPEADRAQFEEAYFADDSLLDRVEAEEDVLVSDYVLGKLQETDRRRFEESLLDSPYYRERVETTTRLKRRIQKDKTFRPGATRAGAGGAGRDITGRIFPGRTGVLVAFALLGVLLVAALVSALRLKGQLEEARRPVAARPVEARTVVLDGTEAGAPSARRVSLPRGAPMVLAFPRRLLPPGEPSFRLYLKDPAGATAWASEPQPLAPSAADGDPSVRIPPGRPPAGTFTVELTGASGASWSARLEFTETPSPPR